VDKKEKEIVYKLVPDSKHHSIKTYNRVVVKFQEFLSFQITVTTLTPTDKSKKIEPTSEPFRMWWWREKSLL